MYMYCMGNNSSRVISYKKEERKKKNKKGFWGFTCYHRQNTKYIHVQYKAVIHQYSI